VDGNGQASSHVASLALEVVAPYWRRWWFSLIGISILLAAIYGAHQYDVRRRLEVEGVRMRIARDLHDHIGSGLSQIAILSEVAQRSSANASASAAQIAEVSRELVDSMSDIVWAINPARDNLPDLAQRMRRFASDLLTSRDVGLEFQSVGLEPAAAIGPEIRRQVYLIFRECIRNVARHSGCTKVQIHVARQGGWLVLRIADDGVGFEGGAVTNGTGIASLRDRAQSLGGRIEWEKCAGTIVTLRVPLPV
jgi:signal transduction histidine kinase